VLFSNDVACHREVSGIVQHQGSIVGHKIKKFRLSMARHHIAEAHPLQRDGRRRQMRTGSSRPIGGVLGAGGRTRGAQLRKLLR